MRCPRPNPMFIVRMSAARRAPLAALTLAAWLAHDLRAQTVVTGGDPATVISVADLLTAGNLQFVQGTGAAGILQLTSGGTFTNGWSINDAIARFDLGGNSLTISSLDPSGNTATGTCTIEVENGALTLGSSSFLAGFTGTLTAGNGGSLVIQQSDWLTATTVINLSGTAGTPTLTWDSNSPVTYSGALNLVGGSTSTIATAQDTGVLTLNGAVAGTGNLALRHTSVTAGPTIVLGLTGGFTGRTILETANVRVNTQASIGSEGLTLDGATLTAGTDLEIGATQVLEVASTSTIVGTGAAGSRTVMTVTGEMQGGGDLTLDAMDFKVDGTTSTFTGNVSLRGGTALSVSNDAWLAGVGTISMNADGAATALRYTGAAAGSFAGLLDVGAGIATISSGQDFSLTGTIGGTGDLLVTRTTGSTAEIGLGFTAGSFTGTTIVSSTAARLVTANSVGDAGLTLAAGDLTIDAGLGSLTIGAAQAFTVTGSSSVTGDGGALPLTVDGTMAGTGTLTLNDIDMTVNGAASTFTGGVRLASGSGLTVANDAWVGALGALAFDAASTVSYTGAAAATFDGSLTLADDATIQTSGAAAARLTLSGAVSGTGDLTLEAVSGSTAGFTLGLTGGFDGSTIVNDADVRINTNASIGQDGLQLNDLDLTGLSATIGTNLTLGDAQGLAIEGTVSMAGSGAGLVVNAQGGLQSAAAATLALDDLGLTVGDGAASTFTGDITLTDGATLTLDGANLSGVDVASVAGGDAVTLAGIGTVGSIGSVATPFLGNLNLGDLGASATSVLNVTGDARLAAASTLQSHFLSSSAGAGTADRLSVGGSFVAGGATASLVFDPNIFTGTWIPAAGQTESYTFVDAAGGFSGTFATVNVVTIDPITGLSTTRTLDQSGETRFLGGGFSVGYGADSFSVSILGIGGPDPLPPGGTTDTNVIVPVQVGATTVNRRANVGVVSNAQINASVEAMNDLLVDPSATADAKFVATQILLNDAPAYASAVVASSGMANPQALPTSLMLGMFDTGDVSMRRLMQLRPTSNRSVSPGAVRGQDRASAQQSGGLAGTAVAPPVAVSRRNAFGAELYGPSPDTGIRGWARGFGWTGSFDSQPWAQTSYSSVIGGAMVGGDVAIGGGGIVGAFVGYLPGSVDVTGGLVDESMSLNGVNFGLYGSWVPDGGSWYLAGSATGAWASIDRTRTLYIPGAVRTADSSSTAWSASVMGETGWNTWLGGDSYIDPYVRAAFGYVNQGSYAESGAGSLNLSVGDQEAYALQPSVGARYMHGIRTGTSVLTPYVGGAFTAIVPMGDWSVAATNSFTSLPLVQVYGDPETQYGGSVEAGVELAMPSGFTVFVAFNGMFLNDGQVLGGSAGIVIPF